VDMECTRLRPASGLFAGKRIFPDGRIHSDVAIKMWKHERLHFTSLEALQDDLQRTQRENCCLIRGTTESTEQPIRRLKTNFLDTPTTFFALDVENVRHANWLDDARAAIEASVIAPLQSFIGEAGYLVALTGTAGLIRDPETKAWTGNVGGGEIRCRIYFHLQEPLDSAQAKKLMLLMREKLPGIDIALGSEVQIHYCVRPQFVGRGALDPVFDRKVPLLWMRSGDYLAIPSDLDSEGSWAEAEERARVEDSNRDVDHPDAESAIAGIDGEIYPHVRCAVRWLVREGRFDSLSPEEQALEIYQIMASWAEKHRAAILVQSKREWKDIQVRLERGRDYALWLLERDDQVRGHGVVRKCIAWTEPDGGLSLEAGREALARAGDAFIEAFDQAEEGADDSFEPHELVRALRSTLGGGKSRMGHDVIPRLIARAIEDDASVILACARHTLGAEQQQRFLARYACKGLVCGQWRGRQADDPQLPGHPMCERHEEARAVGLAGGGQRCCANLARHTASSMKPAAIAGNSAGMPMSGSWPTAPCCTSARPTLESRSP
jgi:hypothetical protein